MSKFTQTVAATFDFEGDNVGVKFRRMLNKHMLQLTPYLVPDPAGPVGSRIGIGRSAVLIDKSKDVLKECVLEFSGLKDEAGNAVSFETALEEAYFLPLVDQILGELMRTSMLSEADAKKFAARQAAARSDGSASPTPSPESSPTGGTTLSSGAPT